MRQKPTRLVSILGALVLLLGAGCATAKKKPSVAAAPPPVPVSGTDLDQTNVEKVRSGETLKAYPIGRYVDPNDPNVMHESHVVYRKEAGANWNLAPNAPTVVLRSRPSRSARCLPCRTGPRSRIPCRRSWSKRWLSKTNSWPRSSSKTRRLLPSLGSSAKNSPICADAPRPEARKEASDVQRTCHD